MPWNCTPENCPGFKWGALVFYFRSHVLSALFCAGLEATTEKNSSFSSPGTHILDVKTDKTYASKITLYSQDTRWWWWGCMVCVMCVFACCVCVCVRKGIPGSGQVGSGRPRSPVTMSSVLCPLKWDHWEYNLSLLTLYTVGKWQNSHINTSNLFLKEGTKQSWIKINFYFRQGKGFESIHFRHICWVLICNRLCVCCKWMRDPPWYPRTWDLQT